MHRVKVSFRQRYRDSRRILGQSFRLINKHRDLWWFPAGGFVITMVFMVLPVVLLWPKLQAWFDAGIFADAPYLAPLAYLVLMPLMYPFAVVASMLNAAMAFSLYERLDGRTGSKSEAWARARGQLGAIARFNAIAMLVTGIFAAIGMLLDKLRIVPGLARVVELVGTWAWAAATFFVIPIIVVEQERRATDAIKSSLSLARDHWGKSVSGMITITLALMVPMVVFLLLWMPIAMLFGFQFGVLGTVLMLLVPVFLTVFLVGIVGQAATTAYQIGLYRYARTGKVDGFDEATLVDPWKAYQA